MRKAKSHRDHMFELMKDRKFFDAWMDEPCPKCSDLESKLSEVEQKAVRMVLAIEESKATGYDMTDCLDLALIAFKEPKA